MNVRLNKDQKVKILNSQDIFKIMQLVLLRENRIRRNQEHFWVVGLDNAHKILFIELVSLGAVNRVQIAPPEVFRMAIYKLAVRMILVHNHPSGNLKPSRADLDFTDRMIKSGQIINIEVLDHLVISEEGFTSFADEGLMDELRNSGMYELVDKEKALLFEQLKVDKARLEEKQALARKLKKEGMDEDFIKKMTGLRKWDIRKL